MINKPPQLGLCNHNYTYEFMDRLHWPRPVLISHEQACRCRRRGPLVRDPVPKCIAGVFWSEMCTKHCKGIGLPPAVTISFGIELARSLFFFRSFFLSLFYFFARSLSLSLPLSLSLSLCRFCGKFPSNNVMCSRDYLAITDNLSDNLAKTICCTRSPGQAIEPFS